VSLFPIQFRAGIPVYEQVLYAARKAIISKELKPGDIFPSVRAMSAEYRINPNTVQKALTALQAEGLIESLPGIGNRVARVPKATAEERRSLLDEPLESIVIRAKQLNLSPEDLKKAIDLHWNNL
jgi:GntR family transcriptional regulator